MRLQLSVPEAVRRNPEVVILVSSKVEWRDSVVGNGDVAGSDCKIMYKP